VRRDYGTEPGMSDDTWEQQMADRAAKRAIERAAADPARSHYGHHQHLDGDEVYCSCGEDRGVITYVIPQEWLDHPELEDEWRASISCDVCGKKGVIRIGRHPLWGVTWALDDGGEG